MNTSGLLVIAIIIILFLVLIYCYMHRKSISNKIENMQTSRNDNLDRYFTHRGKKFVKKDKNDLMKKFNIDDLLPKEKKNWFDIPIDNVPPASIERHVGVNTNPITRRLLSKDLREDIPVPKIAPTPWMQSSYAN